MSQQLDQRVPSTVDVPPAADISFDDLFPPEGNSTPTTAQSEQPAQPEPAPLAVETPAEPFLKASDRTVYKTQEDAIRGIVEKDTTIDRLRAQLQQATGVDPLTGKTVKPQETAPAEVNYARDPTAYWNATADAVEKKDPAAWARANQKFLNDNFAPIAPILQSVATRNALDQVSSELPGFRELRYSAGFNEMLDSMPMMKQALVQAETNLEATSQLPELYKYSYLMYQGSKANQIVSQQHATQVVAAAPTQPSRPTLSSSAMVPPQPGPVQDMSTSEGRKAIIAAAEARGINNANWKDNRW